MSANIKRIIIVGGGTAGWITAGTIAAKHHSDSPDRVQITLVESASIGTIGVGEGTWPTMRDTLANMGIREQDFIRECDVSFKQGSKFVGWNTGAADDQYYHPFTFPQGFLQGNLAPAWHHDNRGMSFSQAVCPQEFLCEQGRGPKLYTTPEYAALANYAYHLNAGTFSAFLKRHCIEKLGVQHLVDEVTAVNAAENGDIASVSTSSNGKIEGDLFIDCTGFASLLLGEHYGVRHVDKSDVLFVDTALAVQIPYQDENSPIASATIATAQPAGWIWDIGLSSRRGVGHVYSSRHSTQDAAEAILRDYVRGAVADVEQLEIRKIGIRSGHREKFWERNCVAVGLSAGFLEPLEASALVLVELSAQMIAEQLPVTREAMDIVARRFNDRFLYRWARIIDFLKLHYVLSKRSDNAFWEDNRRAESIPDSLQELLALWKTQYPWHSDLNQREEVFGAASYQYVLYGMGFRTADSHLGTTTEYADFAEHQFKECERIKNRLGASLPTNRALLRQISGDAPDAAEKPQSIDADFSVLDSTHHRYTRIITASGEKYGDNVCMATVVPHEFRNLIAHYPIFINKDTSTNEYSLCALFGFEEGENLFLNGNEWAAGYIPLHIQRRPFLITIQPDKRVAAGEKETGQMLILIDMKSPRVQEDMGEPLFVSHGEASPYLKKINTILNELVNGTKSCHAFLSKLDEHKLIGPMGINIDLGDGRTSQLGGLYGVSVEKEKALPNSVVRELHASGYLELIYLMRASHAHISTLIYLKNKRLKAA
jgi:2-polyprenyl-6-methoxyphenol hydroxylase-like FAD-dependent oxidoreductase